MKRVKWTTGYSPLILLQILCISFSSFAQTKQSFRNHEEIEIGNGMKVEILKCTGEGPTEECDCIYFTDIRQNGKRMKVAASTIKEEERAANLAKNINKTITKKSSPAAVAADDRADKAIPASIVPKPKVPGTKQPITLEEAVKQADSVAAVSSKRINEQMAKEVIPEDSTDAAGTTAATQPAVPAVKNVEKTVSAPATLTRAKEKEIATAILPETKPQATLKDTLVNNAAPARRADMTAVNPKNVLPVSKDTSVNDRLKETPVKGSPADVIAKEATDAEEQTYVKQYGNVKKPVTQPEQPVVKILPKEVPVNTQPVKSADIANKQSATANNTVTPVTKPASSSVAVAAPVAENKSSAVAGATQTVTETSAKEPSAGVSIATADDEKMKVIGRSAEVNVKGVWVNATIIDKETEFLYKVHYHGKSNEEDEWVAVTQIRNIDTTVYKVPSKTAVVTKGTYDNAIENKAQEKRLADAKAAEELKAAQTKAAEAKLAETKAVESKAAELKLAETKAAENRAAEAKAAEQKLAGTKAAEAKAAELKLDQAKAAENKVAEAKTAETKLAETKAAEAKLAETKAAENKVAEAKAAELKLAETKAVENKAAEAKAAELKLAETKAEEAKAAENKVAEAKATELKLAGTKAAETKVITDTAASAVKPAIFVNCRFEAPASVVYNTQPFTEKVAKRKIYDNYVLPAKVKTGVTFLSFKVEEPYVNTVSVAASGSVEPKLPIAPAGTLIYPVQTEYKVCEVVLGRISSKTMQKNYVCFRNKEGAWTCEMTGQ